MPALSYWTIVLEPPAPVESAPLPYSTKVEAVAGRDRVGLGGPVEVGAWNVLMSLICGEGGRVLVRNEGDAVRRAEGEARRIAGRDQRGELTPVFSSTWPKAPSEATEA